MAYRAELEDTIASEALRPEMATGWSLEIDKVGASPHMQCMLTNSAGMARVFTVLFSEGLSVDEITETCLIDVIEEIRRRRQL